VKGKNMAEILSIELKKATPSGISRLALGKPPLGVGDEILMTSSEDNPQPILPTVKKIQRYKFEIDQGRIFQGPSYLVTFEEDLKMVVDANDVALVLYRNEKK
jgi:hypothetical protein